MSTRASKRARGEGIHHNGAHDPIAEPRPDTQTPVPERDRGSTSTDSWNPPCELANVNAALQVPDCPYNIDEIHFLLWYILTTTLSPDKIAELFNHYFEPAQPIDRWAMLDIFNVIEARWQSNGKSFGENFRLVRPKAHGTCPCDFPDFNIDCLEVKRTAKTRQNQKYLTMAASLWDQPAADLVTCPRGRRKNQPDSSPITPDPVANAFPSGPVTTYFREVRPHIHAVRTAATYAFWLGLFNLSCAPLESHATPVQRHLGACLNGYPSFAFASLHFLFESLLHIYFGGDPDFASARVRAMLTGEFVGHACLRVFLTATAIKTIWVLCAVLGTPVVLRCPSLAWPLL